MRMVACAGCCREADADREVVCSRCFTVLPAESRPASLAVAPAEPATPARATAPSSTTPSERWLCSGPDCPGIENEPEAVVCALCAAPRPAARPASTGSVVLELVEVGGLAVVRLTGSGPWRIGSRQPQSPELVRFDTVSGEHAEISLQDGRAFVVDLHSTNGTAIDHIALTPEVPAPLDPSSMLSLGPEVHFKRVL